MQNYSSQNPENPSPLYSPCADKRSDITKRKGSMKREERPLSSEGETL
jgi:hypothetical protein